MTDNNENNENDENNENIEFYNKDLILNDEKPIVI